MRQTKAKKNSYTPTGYILRQREKNCFNDKNICKKGDRHDIMADTVMNKK